MKSVGVIGGLGPAATLDFFAKMIAAAHAKTDQEHVRLIIDNNPTLPNRNDALAGKGPSPGPGLAAMAQGLERAGADFLVMVCNTAHAWRGEIEAAVRIPFLSMIDLTADALAAAGAKSAGLLIADGARAANLYQDALAARKIAPLLLPEAKQARFMELVYAIKAGDTGADVRAAMRALAGAFQEEGTDFLLAGCTEIPLVLDAADAPLPLISSTDILVAAALEAARA